MKARGVPAASVSITLTFDRPFLFAIIDRATQMVVMSGRVMQLP